MLKVIKTLLIGGCATATVILACILPALAVLSFGGFAAAMLICKERNNGK